MYMCIVSDSVLSFPGGNKWQCSYWRWYLCRYFIGTTPILGFYYSVCLALPSPQGHICRKTSSPCPRLCVTIHVYYKTKSSSKNKSLQGHGALHTWKLMQIELRADDKPGRHGEPGHRLGHSCVHILRDNDGNFMHRIASPIIARTSTCIRNCFFVHFFFNFSLA